MASLKALRNRIQSISSTKKITKAMQMVAASKLRQTKQAMENSLPYYQTATNMLSKLSDFESEDLPKLAKLTLNHENVSNNYLLILVSSDRGLCGGFNNNLFKLVKKYINKELNNKNYKLITIGTKAKEWAKYNLPNEVVLQDYNAFSTNTDFNAMFDYVNEQLEDENFDNLKLFYNHFKNTVSQIPTTKNIIPHNDNTEATKEESVTELEGQKLPETIVSTYLHAALQFAVMQNGTGEQAARMVAMDNATKNASEMIEKLTLQMNRQRQATVTNELIEIISGAEAI